MSGRFAAIEARARGLDRGVVAGVLALLGVGFLLSLAASPVAASRDQAADPFDIALRYSASACLAAFTFLIASLCEPKTVRRAALALYLLCLPLLLAVLIAGPDIKGASRWILVAGVSFQPSEVLKPALVTLVAWMAAEKLKTPSFPGYLAAGGLVAPAALLLLLQPDVGQTALLAAGVAVVLFLGGAPLVWAPIGVGGAAAAGGLLYWLLPYVRTRIDTFLDPTQTGYQVRQALSTISSGGLFGRGPGEGRAKMSLPDAHGDFIYAVAAEEFGLLLSVGLLALYAAIAWRGLAAAQAAPDPFRRLAAGGLFAMFAFQAAIHVAVNLDLAPTKGMTLPLVSHGGSSMLGSALTLGFAVALVRRPGSARS